MLLTYGLISFILLSILDSICSAHMPFLQNRRNCENDRTKVNQACDKTQRNTRKTEILCALSACRSPHERRQYQYAILEYRQVAKIGRYDDKVREIDVRTKLAKIYKSRNAVEDAKRISYYETGAAQLRAFFNLGIIFSRLARWTRLRPISEKAFPTTTGTSIIITWADTVSKLQLQ